MAYLVTMYRIHRHANGHVSVVSECQKSHNEEQVKHLKAVNKEIGYKYVGRFKDNNDNYYTKYERKDEKLSNAERDVIFRVKITKLT